MAVNKKGEDINTILDYIDRDGVAKYTEVEKQAFRDFMRDNEHINAAARGGGGGGGGGAISGARGVTSAARGDSSTVTPTEIQAVHAAVAMEPSSGVETVFSSVPIAKVAAGVGSLTI